MEYQLRVRQRKLQHLAATWHRYVQDIPGIYDVEETWVSFESEQGEDAEAGGEVSYDNNPFDDDRELDDGEDFDEGGEDDEVLAMVMDACEVIQEADQYHGVAGEEGMGDAEVVEGAGVHKRYRS